MPAKKRVTSPRIKPLPTDDDDNYLRRPSGIATDSYRNAPARLGDGTPNLTQSGEYPLIRLTEDYPLILSLYRSSWIVRRVIDTVANDMYRKFPILDSEITPEEVTAFSKTLQKTCTVPRLRSAAKWGRLFGGAAAVMIIEGHDDLMQPLELDDIELGAYKGLIPLDRWSGIIPGPVISSNINDPSSFGLPSYYNVIMDSGNVNVHHSRILRFTGRELPQWEVQVELYWGMSEVEIIFDELRKRDYSSWNIVSLLTRAQILAIEEPQLATLMSGGGGSNKNFNSFVDRMQQISELLNNQGLLILGKDGNIKQTSYGFGGVSEVYHEFMKDLAASTGIPYEIIFGREAGLGSGSLSNNNNASLQIYEELIEEKRTSEGNPIIDKLLPVIAMSTFGSVPDDLAYHWAPLRALSDKERNDLGKSAVESVLMAYNADLVTKREARKELKQQSGNSGMFSNITDESIARTPDTYASEQGVGEILNSEGEEVQGSEQEQSEQLRSEGARSGENVPVESKPIGVQGLKWHKSKRIQGQSTPDMTGKTTPKSLSQSVQHSIKHESKRFDGSALGLGEPMAGRRK